MHDSAILLGRMGFCFTLLFGLPLVTLPCREAFRAVPVQIRNWRINASLAKEFKEVDQRRKEGAHLIINGVDFDEYDPMLATDDPEKMHVTMLSYGSVGEKDHVIGYLDDVESVTTSGACTSDTTQSTDISKKQTHFDSDPSLHFVSTILVVGVCYAIAISVPGVGFVWSLAGSSMAILIAFVVPTACYLRIRHHKRMNPRSISAWTLLLVSSIAAPICTQQAIRNAC